MQLMSNIIKEDVKSIIENIDFSELNNKEVLITGASGLLGTYFLYTLDSLIENGLNIKKVHAVIKSESPQYLKSIFDKEWVCIHRGDLSDSVFQNSLPNADYMIHAAGYAQPAKFVVREDKTIKVNTMVTFNLLDRLNNGGKFLFISSSGIYNGLNKEKFLETDVGTTNVFHPRACYIEGKKCGETIINSYKKLGIDAKSARLSYTYGPGVRGDDERVLYSFIRKAKTGKINMLDSGASERIYCYISDAVEMLWKILLFGKESLYNVGGKEKITVLEIAEIVSDYFNAELVVPKSTDGFLGSACLERLDITRYEDEFSKKDFISVKEGIHRTIEWLADQKNRE